MLLSIIIPTYNRAYIIENAIKSVLEQGYANWELLIIDDGSTDNTKDIVAKYLEKDFRINWFEYENNMGVNHARNLGIKNAKGDYIIFLDSDDQVLENAFDIIIENIENYPDMTVYRYMTENEKGEKRARIIGKYQIPTDIKSYLSGTKIYGEFLTVVRNDVMKDNLFVEGLNGFEGITWYLIAKEQMGKQIYINKVLRFYNNSTDSIIRDSNITKKKIENSIRGYELKLNIMGNDLKKYNLYGKEGYVIINAVLGKLYMLIGDKKNGIKCTLKAIKYNLFELRCWRNLFLLFFAKPYH